MSDSPAERVRLLRESFARYEAGDMEGMLETLHPEVEVTAPEWMNPGPFHGRDGYVEWAGKFNEAWGTLELEVREVEAIGERHVVADVMTRGTGSESGLQVERPAGWMVEVRDGLGVYVEVLLSVDAARHVALRREAEGA